MSKPSILSVPGLNGHLHPFQVFPRGTQFNPMSAVYAVLHRQPDGTLCMLYVGQTEDLSQLAIDQSFPYGFQLGENTYIGVLLNSLVLSAQQRLEVEQELIKRNRPFYNH